MNRDLRAETLFLIDRALREDISVDDACQFLSGLERNTNRAVEESAHAVVHFLTDKDLRSRDADYDSMLRAELEARKRSL